MVRNEAERAAGSLPALGGQEYIDPGTPGPPLAPRARSRELMAARFTVRRALTELAALEAPAHAPDHNEEQPPLVLVALSGGADSLALAAATAAEAPRSGVRAGALVVDHGLQSESAAVAAAAAAQAVQLGLDPVLIERVDSQLLSRRGDGPEAAARVARYDVFTRVAQETGASAVLTAHTRDDQAEQVLLGLARGSGPRSLAGIPGVRRLTTAESAWVLRPFLSADPQITRATTEAACVASGLDFWRDPHNADHRYARVRVRSRVLPLLETELGPGVAAALARSADLIRQDAEELDAQAAALAEKIVAQQAASSSSVREAVAAAGIPVESAGEAAIELPVEHLEIPTNGLSEMSEALRSRVIRYLAETRFGARLSLEHTRAVSALLTDWRGQGPAFVPGLRVERRSGMLRLQRQWESPRSSA